MHWTVMPMGALNASTIFAAMMSVLQERWLRQAITNGLARCGSKVIIDDIILYASTATTLLDLFRVVLLVVLQHYNCSLSLKKCRFLLTKTEFVGVNVSGAGNSPASSKFIAFKRLPRPNLWTDLQMLIGMFGWVLPKMAASIRDKGSMLAQHPSPATQAQLGQPRGGGETASCTVEAK
jgi:hypothetical protein